MGVEPGSAGEVEDGGVVDVGFYGGMDVFVFDEGDGFFADGVVGGLNFVVLGGHFLFFGEGLRRGEGGDIEEMKSCLLIFFLLFFE